MCGFCGFIDKTSKNKKQEIIKSMANRIIHRGPDSDGYYIDDCVALGFRRLAIIDLNNGDQPIFNEDKSIAVLFNGEIYNYQEIREDLVKKGHLFLTNSDTEVIVHGYEEYHEKLFVKLRGMFAIVIYDIKIKKIIGARDYFGIKPFYYYDNDNLFMVGSEIKSFLSHPNFHKELNEQALQLYLSYGTNHMEETFFKNVKKLKPGCYLEFCDGNIIIKDYYKLEYEKDNRSYKYYYKLTKQIIESSIKYHQISDVEVGSYLSGGVDSSYVVAEAKPTKTFTVGFDQKGFSEVDYAKELSQLLKVNHYSKIISDTEFFNILPTVVYHCDEPSANVSTVPLYFLSRLAREQVKVVLSGEGADEMFGGYNEYNPMGAEKIYLLCPYIIRKLIGIIIKHLPNFKGKNTLIKYSKRIENRYYNKTEMFLPEEVKFILNDKYKNSLSPFDLCSPYYKKVKGCNDIEKKMYIDINFWLPNDILLKADKMSMANSVELRVPFLDKEVWDVSKKIPTKYLIRNGMTKEIFRRIANNIIPKEWSMRKKLGFPVPFGKWIKEKKYYSLVKKTFNSKEASEFFNIQEINSLLDKHYQKKESNGKKIYCVYIYLIWYKRFFIDEV